MKTIELTQGKVAVVDDADYRDLKKFNWWASRGRYTFYAIRSVWINKRGTTEKMHRRILGLKQSDGKSTDHIDSDGLNNQRSNLRICTNAENCRNQNVPKNNTSGFKGVYWHKQTKKWEARIKVDYKYKHLGLFTSLIDAALTYNRAANKYFGKFAKLNQIEGVM